MSSDPERIPTGLSGLDRILGGGLLPGSVTLVAGGFGTGKTILGLQFLLRAARSGTRGIYISCQADPDHMIYPLAGQQVSLKEYYRKGIIAREYRKDPDAPVPEVPDLSAAVLDGISAGMDREELARVRDLLDHFRTERVAVLVLYHTSQETGRTGFGTDRMAQYCDTVISLAAPGAGQAGAHGLEVIKTRTGRSAGSHLDFTISAKGITLKRKGPKVRVRDSKEALIFHPNNLFQDKWQQYFEAVAQRVKKKLPGPAVRVVNDRQIIADQHLARARTPVAALLVPLNELAEYIRKGLLKDLNRLPVRFKQEQYLDRALGCCRREDKLFALPRFLDYKIILYRKDLLKKYGFSPPGSWEELAAQARQILQKEKDPDLEGLIIPAPLLQSGLSDLFIEYLWAAGGDIYDAGGSIDPDNIRGRQALAFMRSLAGEVLQTESFPVIFQNMLRKFFTGGGVFLYQTLESWNWYLSSGASDRNFGTCVINDRPDVQTPACKLLGAALAVPRTTRFPEVSAALFGVFDDEAWNRQTLEKLGFTEGLNTLQSSYPRPGGQRYNGRHGIYNRGCFLFEREPYDDAAPVIVTEALEVIRGRRSPERALRRIYEQFWLHRQRDKYNDCVNRAVYFMEMQLDRPIRLKEIADHVSVSPRHLNRIFRMKTGYNCIDYLIHQRLERAQVLLSTTADPVLQVARRCGYPDQNYFSGQFKRKIGLSPTAYRQQYRS